MGTALSDDVNRLRDAKIALGGSFEIPLVTPLQTPRHAQRVLITPIRGPVSYTHLTLPTILRV